MQFRGVAGCNTPLTIVAPIGRDEAVSIASRLEDRNIETYMSSAGNLIQGCFEFAWRFNER